MGVEFDYFELQTQQKDKSRAFENSFRSAPKEINSEMGLRSGLHFNGAGKGICLSI